VALEELEKNTFKYSAIITEVQRRYCEGLSLFLPPVVLKKIIGCYYPLEICCSEMIPFTTPNDIKHKICREIMDLKLKHMECKALGSLLWPCYLIYQNSVLNTVKSRAC